MPLLLPALGIDLPYLVAAGTPVQFNPQLFHLSSWGIAAIALAGPLTNLALAIIAAIIDNYFRSLSFVVITLTQQFIALNVSLFLVNIMPMYPLDGGIALNAFLPPPLAHMVQQMLSPALVSLAAPMIASMLTESVYDMITYCIH